MEMTLTLFYSALGAAVPVIVWEIIRLLTRRFSEASKIPNRLNKLEDVIIQISKETSIQTDALQ